MTKSRRKLAAVLGTVIAAGCFAFVGSTPASAHFSESSLSLGVDDRTAQGDQKLIFFGKLSNNHSKCRKNQEVELVRRGSGVVDVDLTDSEGEYFFRYDPQPNRGRFFTRYQGKSDFGYNDNHGCSQAVSDGIRIRRG